MDAAPRPLLAPLGETRVNDRVLVFSTGGEDLATGWGANAVAVLGDGETLVVDPLVAPAYARDVKRRLAALQGLGPERTVARLRERFPGYRLEAVLETTGRVLQAAG